MEHDPLRAFLEANPDAKAGVHPCDCCGEPSPQLDSKTAGAWFEWMLANGWTVGAAGEHGFLLVWNGHDHAAQASQPTDGPLPPAGGPSFLPAPQSPPRITQWNPDIRYHPI
jgi:hypothetical protein